MTARTTFVVLLIVVVIAIAWLFTSTRPDHPVESRGRTPDDVGGQSVGLDGGVGSGGRDAAGRVETAHSDDGTCQVSILSLPDRDSPVGTEWRLSRASTVGVVRQVRKDVPWLVPPGSWDIEPLTQGWHCLDSRLDTKPGEPAVAWVYRDQKIGVLVTVDDQPVVGASVAWIPTSRLGLSTWETDPSETVTTDAGGRATLSLSGGGIGILCSHAEGFAPDRRVLHGNTPDPVRIELREARDPYSVAFVLDAETGKGIRGAQVLLPPHVVAVTDPVGAARVPGFVAPGDRLIVRAGGYCPVAVALEDIRVESEVRLMQSIDQGLRIVASPEPVAGEVVIFPRIEALPEGVRVAPELTVMVAYQPPSTVVPLPLGASVRLLAVAADGRSGTAVARIDRDLGPVEIALETGAAFVLDVRAESGAAIENAESEIVYDGPRKAVRTSAGSRIVVGAPETVEEIRLSAPGFVGKRLQPIRGQPQSGALALTLARAHSASVRLVDAAERPIVGVSVSARPSWDDAELLRMYPELHGGRPTAHPGWSGHAHGAAGGVSDASGRCRLKGLEEGTHALRLAVPTVLNPRMRSLYRPQSRSIYVPCTGEITWRVPGPRQVAVEAFDGSSEEPIASISVSVEGDEVQREIPGNLWSGWIPADLGSIAVSSSGYRTAVVELDPGDHPALERVGLQREIPLHLVFEGDVTGLPGARIGLVGLKQASWGLTQVWSGTATIDGLLGVEVSPAMTPGLFLQLESPETPAGRWTFDPNTITWDPGARLRIQVEFEPR